jgi:hypothetical protein
MRTLWSFIFSFCYHSPQYFSFKCEILFQAPFVESGKADEPLTESSSFSVYSSIDLYSDQAGDTNWGGQNNKLMNETSSKSIGHHTGSSAIRKGKNVLMQPNTLSTTTSYARQVPAQNLPRHGSVHEIASKLNAVSEEGENDSESDEQSVSDSSERSSCDTPILFQVNLHGFGIGKISSRSVLLCRLPSIVCTCKLVFFDDDKNWSTLPVVMIQIDKINNK